MSVNFCIMRLQKCRLHCEGIFIITYQIASSKVAQKCVTAAKHLHSCIFAEEIDSASLIIKKVNCVKYKLYMFFSQIFSIKKSKIISAQFFFLKNSVFKNSCYSSSSQFVTLSNYQNCYSIMFHLFFQKIATPI